MALSETSTDWLELMYPCGDCDHAATGAELRHMQTCPGCSRTLPPIVWDDCSAPEQWLLNTGRMALTAAQAAGAIHCASERAPSLTECLDLPESVRTAASLTNLFGFLGGAAAGFHWDILDRMEDGVYLLDRTRHIMYWSRGAERITGYRAEQVLGHTCSDNILNHVDACGQCLCIDGCPMARVIATGSPECAEVFLQHARGHRVPVRVYGAPLYDDEGEIIGAFETFSDTTALLAPVQQVRQLEQLAFLDAVTGIGNRRLVEKEMDRRFRELREDGWTWGVVLLDIDHFKSFNDAHGHSVGDQVLRVVADTLRHNCRSHDLVGRWGGEEFLTVASARNTEELRSLAETHRAMVGASSLDTGIGVLRITVSAGATLALPNDTPDELLKRADALLYRSKTHGRNMVSEG